MVYSIVLYKFLPYIILCLVQTWGMDKLLLGHIRMSNARSGCIPRETFLSRGWKYGNGKTAYGIIAGRRCTILRRAGGCDLLWRMYGGDEGAP